MMEARQADVVSIVAQLDANPDQPHWDSLFEKLEDEETLTAIDPETATAMLGAWLRRFPGIVLEEKVAASASRMLAPAERILRHQPDNALLLALMASLLRKLNRLSRALELAQMAYQGQPGWHTALEVALAYRARHEIERSLTAYRIAQSFDPGNQTTHLDMADMLWDHDRLEEAAQHYRAVLEKEPGQAWAEPSLEYLTFLLHGDERASERLHDLAERSPRNERAFALSGDLKEMLGPYVGYIPEPADATIEALRRFRSELTDAHRPVEGSEVRLALSHLEAPSARLAFERELVRLGLDLRVDFAFGKIPEPDPRLARGPVDFVLWRYEGTTASPNLDEPSDPVVEAIASIASSRYARQRWKQRTEQAARAIGPGAYLELAAIMAHPPPGPPDLPSWIWIQRIQIAAALTLAKLDGGWRRSIRKKALCAIFSGPVDWATDAAVLALTEIALERPDTEREILSQFRGLLLGRPKQGYCCYEYGLVANMLRLPSIGEGERAELLARKSSLETNGA
jgi:tetratricopeptide (TPR) repeat protein